MMYPLKLLVSRSCSCKGAPSKFQSDGDQRQHRKALEVSQHTVEPSLVWPRLKLPASLMATVLYVTTMGHIDPSSSVAQSCLTLCDPMDCSMPGFPGNGRP